jgi:hypothetical protein
LLFLSDDGSDLVGLQFRNGKADDFSIIEPTAAAGCPFQPTVNRVSLSSFDSSDRRFVQTLDTEGGNLVKDPTPMLDSNNKVSGYRAERLPTGSALVATTLAPEVRIGTAETLHRWWTL